MNHAIRQSFKLDLKGICSDLLDTVAIADVSGALVFLAPDIDCQSVTSAFDNLFPYAGCTVHSAYTSMPKPGRQNPTATVVFFFNKTNKHASGLIGSFNPMARVFAFSCGDELLNDHLKHNKMLGGVASSSYTSGHKAVWCNHLYSTSATVALSLPQNPLTIHVSHCWSAVDDNEFEVTEISGTRLYQLDSKPVSQVFDQYQNSKSLLASYPLQVVSTGRTVAVLGFSNQDGKECLNLSQPIAPGEKVRISGSTRTELLKTSYQTAIQSYLAAEQHEHSFTLGFSCTSRAWLLGDMEHSEFENLYKLSGNTEQKSCVVYLFGEFEPTPEETRHNNHALVIAAFFSPESDLISEI